MSQPTAQNQTTSERQWIVPFTVALLVANFGFLWMMATYTTMIG